MQPSRVLLSTLCLLAASGCQPHTDRDSAAQTLLVRDRAWARATATGNVDSIVGYWTADARVYLPGQPVYVGSAAVRQMVTSSLAMPGFAITWEPDSAVVATNGDLGYTYGTNRVTLPDSTGATHVTAGRYVEVWRKEPDGQWRCTVDISD